MNIQRNPPGQQVEGQCTSDDSSPRFSIQIAILRVWYIPFLIFLGKLILMPLLCAFMLDSHKTPRASDLTGHSKHATQFLGLVSTFWVAQIMLNPCMNLYAIYTYYTYVYVLGFYRQFIAWTFVPWVRLGETSENPCTNQQVLLAKKKLQELVRRTVPTVPWWDGSRKKQQPAGGISQQIFLGCIGFKTYSWLEWQVSGDFKLSGKQLILMISGHPNNLITCRR